jgi:UDPglucose--hexose-1-phosphate uridylyltransferase
MPEIRHNDITHEWVIIAPERAKRPQDGPAPAPRPSVAYDPDCPFCPGAEDRTPPATFRWPEEGPWRIRAFPNRYSVLDPEGSPGAIPGQPGPAVEGVGLHEVIALSERHDGHLARVPEAQVVAVLHAFQHRFRAMHADPRIRHVLVFVNHGASAGTSIAHPHAQVVGLPLRPARVAARAERHLRGLYEEGTCLVCRAVASEGASGERVIEEGRRFLAYIPWAALSPYHLWIVPRIHASSFANLDEDGIADLARVLHRVLRRLDGLLGDPDFNLVIQSQGPGRDVPHLHWYLSVVPRVALLAGFEIGTGMYINPSIPRERAAALRAVRLDDPPGPRPDQV